MKEDRERRDLEEKERKRSTTDSLSTQQEQMHARTVKVKWKKGVDYDKESLHRLFAGIGSIEIIIVKKRSAIISFHYAREAGAAILAFAKGDKFTVTSLHTPSSSNVSTTLLPTPNIPTSTPPPSSAPTTSKTDTFSFSETYHFTPTISAELHEDYEDKILKKLQMFAQQQHQHE